MVAVTVLPFSLLMLVLKKQTQNFNFSEFIEARGYPLLLLFSMVMYAFLVSTAVGPFKCDYSSSSFVAMFEDPSRSCFDQEWYAHLPVVLFFCILYVLGLPGALVYMFWKNHEKSSFLSAFGTVIKSYRTEVYWWELTVVFKRSIFAIANAFLRVLSTEYASLFTTLCILCFFIVLEVGFRPYKENYLLIQSVA
jgi:hypothetical protein